MAISLLLSALVIGAAPPVRRPDVALADIARFAPLLKLDLEKKQGLANHFSEYAHHHLGREEQDYAYRVSSAIADLRRLKRGVGDPEFDLMALRVLRNGLGDANYAAGVVPPPFPEKHRKAFREFLAKRGIALDP